MLNSLCAVILGYTGKHRYKPSKYPSLAKQMIFNLFDSIMGNINQKVSWLADNPWIAMLSLLLAFAGIIIAVVIYIKSKKTKSVFYAIRNYNLIRDFVSKIPLLKISWDEEKIENVSISKVALWNSGSDVVENRDIASLDPLTISVLSPFKILDKNIIYSKNSKNKLELILNEEGTKIEVKFEFIDRQEGVIIQVIHTGKRKEDLHITGTIKGGCKLARRNIPRTRYVSLSLPFSKKLKLNSGFLFILAPFFFALVVGISLYIHQFYNVPFSRSIGDLLLFGIRIPEEIQLLIITMLLYWPLGFYKLWKRLPKGFEAFEEELE